jgi:hypothetical protein
MSCEFISEMRVNSHSPILEMSLKDVSGVGVSFVLGLSTFVVCVAYPNSVALLPGPF